MTRSATRLALGLLLTGTLAACSQSPVPSADDTLPAGSPYANGAAYPWSDRLEAPVTDPYAAGRDYPWRSPQASSTLDALGLNAGVNYLSDLPWTSASSFWGPIARDKSNGEQGVDDGRTLTLGGRTFTKGLGVHADSSVRYALNAQCSTFSASIGIDDEVGSQGRVTFQVLGDGKELYISPKLTGADAAKAISVSVAGVKELTLNVLKGANTYYDHSDWADAKVTCQAVKPSGTVYVSDLAYTSATNGWGPIEIDRSNGEQQQFDGKPLTINGQVFQKGLGVHAASTITYDLGGACQTFGSTIGIDSETQGRGSVTFQVFGDGRKLYESPVLPGLYGSNQVKATADVTGVKKLQLVVADAGDGKTLDHADWADAKLGCEKAGTPGTLDNAFGAAGHANVGGVDSVTEPDSSVVLLGTDFSLKRLSSSGTVGGSSAVSVPGGTAYALARQANGNLVAVGEANGAVVVVRYLPSLQPDPGFGTGGVKIVQLGALDPVTGVARSYARDVVVQGDGKVVLVGSASAPYSPYPGDTGTKLDYLISRLTQDGTLDAGFGVGGSFVLENSENCDSTYNTDEMLAVALQPDGKVVAAGNTNCIGSYRNVIVRLQSNGQPDPAFSGDGITSASVSSGYGNLIRALLIQPDGSIVFGGATQRFQTAAFVERVTARGAPDGGRYFQIADLPYEQGTIYSLARQNDGKIVFGASSPNNRSLGRLNTDLTLDTSFGSLRTGFVILNQAVTSVNIDSSGRIVASGATDTVRVLP